MSSKRHYISYKEFYNKLVDQLPVGETWRLKCDESCDNLDDPLDTFVYTLVFAKHRYEAEDGCMYPFIVYSYPETLDAGLIQQDEYGWQNSVKEAWHVIVESCRLRPFI